MRNMLCVTISYKYHVSFRKPGFLVSQIPIFIIFPRLRRMCSKHRRGRGAAVGQFFGSG